MTNLDKNEEVFNNQLARVLSGIPCTDKLLLIRDFIARIGRDSDKWPLVMGKHGIGKCNSNGELLQTLCSELPTHALMRLQPSMRWLEQSPAWKMAKHLEEMNSCWSMEARRRQSVQKTALTNRQCLGGGFCTTSMEGCQHCCHLQERWSIRLDISEQSLFFR